MANNDTMLVCRWFGKGRSYIIHQDMWKSEKPGRFLERSFETSSAKHHRHSNTCHHQHQGTC